MTQVTGQAPVKEYSDLGHICHAALTPLRLAAAGGMLQSPAASHCPSTARGPKSTIPSSPCRGAVCAAQAWAGDPTQSKPQNSGGCSDPGIDDSAGGSRVPLWWSWEACAELESSWRAGAAHTGEGGSGKVFLDCCHSLQSVLVVLLKTLQLSDELC